MVVKQRVACENKGSATASIFGCSNETMCAVVNPTEVERYISAYRLHAKLR
jgi:hypothetical protein